MNMSIILIAIAILAAMGIITGVVIALIAYFSNR